MNQNNDILLENTIINRAERYIINRHTHGSLNLEDYDICLDSDNEHTLTIYHKDTIIYKKSSKRLKTLVALIGI
jgi:hypothetical protein